MPQLIRHAAPLIFHAYHESFLLILHDIATDARH